MKFSMMMSAAALFIGTLGSGCLWSSGKPLTASEYDLPLRQNNHRNTLPIRIGVIRNISGAGHNFLLRGENGRVGQDESRRWLLSPEAMLERELRRTFLASEKEERQTITVDAAICRFDLNETKKEFSLALIYTVRDGEKRNSVSQAITQKIEEDNVPEAVEKALGKSALALERELTKEGKK